jgi:pyrroloquinoline-quinone synthase
MKDNNNKNNLFKRLDNEIEERSVLKHIFYQLWSQGKLTIDELRGYSKEYFQLVKLVPSFVENVACMITDPSIKLSISQNIREENEHIEPWIAFAGALGVPRNELLNYTGAFKTNDAVSALGHLTTRSLQEAVAAMYAYEIELPKISSSKIDGLKKFYGMNIGTDATNYFEIHKEADIRHAGLWRTILSDIPAAYKKKDVIFNSAIKTQEALNNLLDSVQETYVKTSTYC